MDIVKIAPIPGWPSSRGTLAHPVSVAGRGLHTGRRCQVSLNPAEAGSGIAFRRTTDDGSQHQIPASWALHYKQPLCTALKSPEGMVVRTTEHLLAALRACGIDDAMVEMSGEELPILDGSAGPWIEALQSGGRAGLAVPLRFIQVLKPVEWTGGARQLRLEPGNAPGLELDLTLNTKETGRWHWQGELTPQRFREEIAGARSYGQALLAPLAIIGGYATGTPILRGARPWCAAAMIGSMVIGGRRTPDEFIKHLVIDLFGDLGLLGAPLLGRLTANCHSHEGNHGIAATLMQHPEAWRFVEIDATAHFQPL